MKSITNDSFQAFQIFVRYPKGLTSIRLKPKESIVVPSSAITDQCMTMARRKLIKIRNA